MNIWNSDLEVRWIQYNISYFDNELNNAPILLFIHWLWCSKKDFVDAEKYLSKYRIISLDFPGCWSSPYNETFDLSTNDLVDLINELVKFLKIKDFFIIGHSYGGLIALKYVNKYWAKGLVSIEWLWEVNSKFSARKTINTTPNKYIKETLPDTISWLKKLNNPGSIKYAETLEKATNPLAFYRYSVSFVNSVDEVSSIEEFMKIDIPKLFICGQNTQWLSFIDSLNGSKIESIENSYHFPNYDNPTDFYKSIENFIDSIEFSNIN